MISDWIEDCRVWPIDVAEKRNPGDDKYIASNGYAYRYFSPYRPLNFVGGIDCVLVQSENPGKDFIYVKAPFAIDRLERWQLVPANDEAWRVVNAMCPPIEESEG